MVSRGITIVKIYRSRVIATKIAPDDKLHLKSWWRSISKPIKGKKKKKKSYECTRVKLEHRELSLQVMTTILKPNMNPQKHSWFVKTIMQGTTSSGYNLIYRETEKVTNS